MNFWEKFKDFLYNSIDYIIMLIVIIAVVCIISWRLDILFVNNGANSTLTKNIENNNDDKKVVENIDGDQNNEASNEDNGEKLPETAGNSETSDEEAPVETAGDTNEEKPAEEKPQEKKPAETGGTIEVNIPAKSLPGEIGKILEQQGVVSSATDFVNKCVELKLDTKLKSGKFTFNKGASLDDVVKIIAQVKK
jgi:cell division protein YceG involved in septum cleavage